MQDVFGPVVAVVAGGNASHETGPGMERLGQQMKPLVLFLLLSSPMAAQEWPTVGKIQTASLAGLALADYHSTQRGLARGGMEANPMLSCGGQLCAGRYGAINAAVVAGTYAITRYAIPRLPKRWRLVTNIALTGMIGARGFIVARNYQRGNQLLMQGR